MTRQQAENCAYALGITLYLRPDGSLSQRPPGDPIDPGPQSRPLPLGHHLPHQRPSTLDPREA